jgi:hypothetical protein
MSTSKKNVTAKNVNLETLTDEQLLTANLDEINIFDLLSKNKSLQPKLNQSKDTKETMFVYPKDADKKTIKNFRTKARKQRNYFIESLLTAYENKDVNKQKEVLKEFKVFYKETYLKNDFSISSISRLNADKNTLAKIKLFFYIISKIK